jgi:hypothetical protein
VDALFAISVQDDTPLMPSISNEIKALNGFCIGYYSVAVSRVKNVDFYDRTHYNNMRMM